MWAGSFLRRVAANTAVEELAVVLVKAIWCRF